MKVKVSSLSVAWLILDKIIITQGSHLSWNRWCRVNMVTPFPVRSVNHHDRDSFKKADLLMYNFEGGAPTSYVLYLSLCGWEVLQTQRQPILMLFNNAWISRLIWALIQRFTVIKFYLYIRCPFGASHLPKHCHTNISSVSLPYVISYAWNMHC